ncbi:MAG: DUF2807 domain-containing protein [Saprospiraceae bacterium]|nr:DUF2807 domain-containing protein [Saprospiraceae bacterium]
MKTINLIKVSFLFVAITMISCEKDYLSIRGEGAITTKTLNISNHSGLDLAVAGNLVISQGPIQEVQATGHPNIIDRIKERVSGGVWTIDLENGHYKDYELTIHVTIPNLNSIALSGSGHVVVNDFTNQDDLAIDLEGSGRIDLNTFSGTENIDIDISGSGTVNGYKQLSSMKDIHINISGSGDYHGFPIKTDECHINITGSGNCNVSVRNSLEVTIKGSGTVRYRGNPTITDYTNKAGSIINAN